ncbi:saccharopine dehydrogenase NADP-binding domain-containing protein [Streptomyces sp. NPDC051133]|uniref:saccharopine dehydrogenase NADP-binding domain-containing protein n=1 Tax=Streptomyces sp. NPDC051133 TaxID=3155521 RepID=UPI0034279031
MTGGTPLIGVLGGYGAVGAAAARCLAAEGFRLRIGGRDRAAAERCAAGLGGPAEGRPAEARRVEARRVDARDDADLERFARGCDVLLHCAGPAYELAARPRRAAAAAGAAYVDVMDGAGPEPAPPGERTAVLSAGLSPGLSGLLPGLLTDGRPPSGGTRFTGHYVMLGAFTRTGALDYLLSLDREYGTARAEWRRGRVVPGALPGAAPHTVPGVPHPVTAYPYLPRELADAADRLMLAEARWYNAFDGHHLLDTLNRHRSGDAGRAGLDARVADVVRASELDAFGRTPYHLLWGVLEPLSPGAGGVRRTVLVRGTDGSAMTGVIGALAAAEVARHRIPPGAHEAAAVLAPRQTLTALRRHLPDTVCTVTETPVDEIPRTPGDETAVPLEDGVL